MNNLIIQFRYHVFVDTRYKVSVLTSVHIVSMNDMNFPTSLMVGNTIESQSTEPAIHMTWKYSHARVPWTTNRTMAAGGCRAPLLTNTIVHMSDRNDRLAAAVHAHNMRASCRAADAEVVIILLYRGLWIRGERPITWWAYHCNTICILYLVPTYLPTYLLFISRDTKYIICLFICMIKNLFTSNKLLAYYVWSVCVFFCYWSFSIASRGGFFIYIRRNFRNEKTN